jgi:hypothetical protein
MRSRFVAASNENLIICRDAAVSGFIALITCEGSSESARQAEPDSSRSFATSPQTTEDLRGSLELQLRGFFSRDYGIRMTGAGGDKGSPEFVGTTTAGILRFAQND